MKPTASRLITAPTIEPVTLIEAKAHLRVTTTDDDTYISSLISSVRSYVETTAIRRALITQTWEAYFDDFDDELLLPYPRLQSVTSVKYKDTAGVETTLAATEYIADILTEPGRVVLAYGKSWPSTSLYPVNPITIRYVAGYGVAATAVPEEIELAIKIMVAHFYEARELFAVGTIVSKIPFSARNLLAPYRIPS
ncbi:MAG: head-tail connector protein [Actinomycetota bacterium]